MAPELGTGDEDGDWKSCVEVADGGIWVCVWDWGAGVDKEGTRDKESELIENED